MKSNIISSYTYTPPEPHEMTAKARHFDRIAKERLERELRRAKRRNPCPIFCLK